MHLESEKRKPTSQLWYILSLIVPTIILYLPTLGAGFIWNDSDYVTAARLQSVSGLRKIWLQLGATEQYYPILHSAFWVEHRLFGDHPLEYHVLNLGFHCICVVLFALLVDLIIETRDMLQSRSEIAGSEIRVFSIRFTIGWLAAFMFAISPVNVETVAWITEEKNTLSLIAFLLSCLAFVKHRFKRSGSYYFLSLAFFVVALGCKTSTAVLPGCLLAIIWWIRGKPPERRDIFSIVPFFLFGGAFALFSSWVELKFVGASGADFALPVALRVLVASKAVILYGTHFVWPFGHHFVYDKWTASGKDPFQWMFLAGIVAASCVVWIRRKKSPVLFFAYFTFLGMLTPVLGFVNLYGSLYSYVWDHWQYLPDLSLFVLVSAAISKGYTLLARRLKFIYLGGIAIVFSVLGAETTSYCRVFRDDLTLFTDTIDSYPDCWMAHNNLGNIYGMTPGMLMDSIREYRYAARLRPNSSVPHYNLAKAFILVPGQRKQAIKEYRESIRIYPDHFDAQYNVGNELAEDPATLQEAIEHYHKAILLRPDSAEAHNNLASALVQLPLCQNEAAKEYRISIKLDPRNARAHYDYANLLVATPTSLKEAIAEYQQAIRLAPDFAEAHFNLGCAFSMSTDHLKDAVEEFNRGLKLEPTLADGWQRLGEAYLAVGDKNAAKIAFEEELRLQPNETIAIKALASLGKETVVR